ncbi:hypothetical protein HY469_04820 [Candidatus Roizmanbacteria bacterium]|nr:hypothetical protein [Candidatus Roizmanbacteria bacterium]
MNTRIALSGLSILTVLSLVGGATFALFSDEATSANNVFATGTLDLQLDDDDETFTDNVSASFGGTDLIPEATVSGFISLHNAGSVAINEVLFGATEVSNSNNADGSILADVLNLTVGTDSDSACDTVSDITGTVAAAIGDNVSPLTLSELIAEDYDALPGLGSDYYLCLTATMDTGAGNTYQGDTYTVDFDFTAMQ